MDSKKFVFICGLHRSGTTLLFRLLREHNQISGFQNTGVPRDEGQHLQTVFTPAKKHGGPGLFAFDKDAYLTEKSALITPENKEKLYDEWSKYWDLSKPILIEKSPPSIIRTRFFQEMFSNSYFIVIKRHPIAVSFATNAFSKKTVDLEKLIEHWLVSQKQVERDLPLLDRAMEIKYEDLVADSDNVLSTISDFIGVDSIEPSLPIKPNTNSKYQEQWMELSQEKRNNIAEKYEKEINAFGYSFSEIP
ncbi:Sulfotransferase family protein [Virgibacillus subterraneus]|uniref:Sulfotransferase family protein n=1 Tax=Virgibacillus subterraneus TaxID=621109 RepID=A0A1H9AHQ4_9BACI|nr:sulfotransferase [Virgibacillus subterraneus]SEP75498.1 Sulfotransferase family protein [Virgibacillus subterraneus]